MEETLNADGTRKETPESLKETPAKPPREDDPICPYCGMDPVLLRRKDLQFPDGLVVAVVLCGNTECRALFSVSPLARIESKGPRIVRPS